MFAGQEREEYIVCFRPITTGRSPEKMRLCCYVEVAIGEAIKSARAKVLTAEIIDDMKNALSGLWEKAQ